MAAQELVKVKPAPKAQEGPEFKQLQRPDISGAMEQLDDAKEQEEEDAVVLEQAEAIMGLLNDMAAKEAMEQRRAARKARRGGTEQGGGDPLLALLVGMLGCGLCGRR